MAPAGRQAAVVRRLIREHHKLRQQRGIVA
jgi:hypothetical protein